jgi:hypothetical protein
VLALFFGEVEDGCCTSSPKEDRPEHGATVPAFADATINIPRTASEQR